MHANIRINIDRHEEKVIGMHFISRGRSVMDNNQYHLYSSLTSGAKCDSQENNY